MENQNLTIDKIRITPELIVTINGLQTGGTDHFSSPIEDKYFNNCTLKDVLNEITDINDFIIEIFIDDPKKFEDGQFRSFLISLNYLKRIIKGLAAPEPVKQTTT